MSLETRALHPTLAVEVVGLRLWESPQPETVAALRELWSHGLTATGRAAHPSWCLHFC